MLGDEREHGECCEKPSSPFHVDDPLSLRRWRQRRKLRTKST